MKKMVMIYEGKEEPIDNIDIDIVDNEMEEEVENGGTPWRAKHPTTFLTFVSLNILYT